VPITEPAAFQAVSIGHSDKSPYILADRISGLRPLHLFVGRPHLDLRLSVMPLTALPLPDSGNLSLPLPLVFIPHAAILAPPTGVEPVSANLGNSRPSIGGGIDKYLMFINEILDLTKLTTDPAALDHNDKIKTLKKIGKLSTTLFVARFITPHIQKILHSKTFDTLDHLSYSRGIYDNALLHYFIHTFQKPETQSTLQKNTLTFNHPISFINSNYSDINYSLSYLTFDISGNQGTVARQLDDWDSWNNKNSVIFYITEHDKELFINAFHEAGVLEKDPFANRITYQLQNKKLLTVDTVKPIL
jgi:hypothetical protein